MSSTGVSEFSETIVVVTAGGAKDSSEASDVCPVNNQTGNESPSQSLRRSERTTALSLKAKENKVIALNTRVAKGWIELSELSETVLSNLNSFDSVEQVDGQIKNVTSLFDETYQLYVELVQLCENKTDSDIEQMTDDISAEVKRVKQKLHSRAQQLNEQDTAEEQQLEAARTEYQRQLKIYEEKRQKRLQRQSHDESPPLRDSQDSRNSRQVDESQGGSPIRNSRPPEESRGSPTHGYRREDESRGGSPTHGYRREEESRVDRSSVAATSSSSTLDVVKEIADSLATAVSRARPRKSVEPEIFSGNELKFIDWEVDFDAYLKAEDVEGHERLRHLKKYTGGDARKCIEGFFVANTNQAYKDAREKLSTRYADKREVARRFKNKLTEWPRIQSKDAKGLQEYGDFLSHLLTAMQSISALRILDDDSENERMVEKLPDWLRNRWAREVARSLKTNDEYPGLRKFVEFIEEETRIMKLPISQLSQRKESAAKPNTLRDRPVKSYLAAAGTNNTYEDCMFCRQSNHQTGNCYQLRSKPYQERVQFITENRLCYSCLRKGHMSKVCTKKLQCKTCHKQHPSAMHRENSESYQNSEAGATNQNQPVTRQKETETTVVTSKSTKKNVTGILAMAVPVYLSTTRNQQETMVYALLDTQSDACFITKEIAGQMKTANCKSEKITLSTLNGETTQLVKRLEGIKVRGVNSHEIITLSAYQQDTISCDRSKIPSQKDTYIWPHLKTITKDLAPRMDIPVGLLIGADCPEALAPLESLVGEPGQPFAIRTKLGWTLCGGQDYSESAEKRKVHKIDISHNVEEEFDQTKVSQDDLKFMEIMRKETTVNGDGNYEMPLPFKNRPALPNNFEQAERRLESLKRRFQKDDVYKEEYTNFMQDLIKNGQAEPVGLDDAVPGEVWYLPHFGVHHPKKRKIRVVYDCAAKYSNTSLNDHLLQGPDQMNNLVGILCRFRKEDIAITCDIEKMFYNFSVTPKDRNYLRFLWMDKDTGTTRIYRMKVHLFGATSSPGVASYGLRKLAEDNVHLSSTASAFLKSDFYVDDGVTSVHTVKEASELIEDARAMCQRGNIRLHKFLCNNREVLDSIPETERCVKDEERLPTQRTLGMEWMASSDELTFTCAENPPEVITRRNILSTVAKVYDPLGLLAPYILRGKLVLQRIVTEKLEWDERVSEAHQREWTSWVQQLPELKDIRIGRCLKPEGFGEVVKVELHHFCDASQEGIGACSYIRLINNSRQIHCSLLLAKSRVAPLKPTTIPRLELQAAVLATRLSRIVHQELRMDIDEELFWSDSTIVLGYIANEERRFHTYVANRVYEIKSLTRADQWHHIRTSFNPADLASRGATVKQLTESTWWSGPEFLWQTDIPSGTISDKPACIELHDEDPEVRTVKSNATTTTTATTIVERFQNFSDWEKLVKAVANLRSIAASRKWTRPSVSTNTLEQAETFIIQATQQQAFSAEINTLRQGSALTKRNKLACFDPFLDDKGILRVGGRCGRTEMLAYREKHPAILPKDLHISTLIVRHFHRRAFHQGRTATLASIRVHGYWILGANQLVKSLVRKCTICQRLRGKPAEQQMGPLPKERLQPSAPFTHVGMDTFGPFIVKDRRTEIKRWGVIFTCLYSRAVHLEVLDDLSSDCFINTLRNFMAIRGPVKTLFCDNGTNFIGARNELDGALNLVQDPQLKDYLQRMRTEFKTNTPDASHQGGVWERLIRSARAVLDGMAEKYRGRWDTATLRTALYEAMAIMNSRPLSVENLNDANEIVLTPNHLLTMKSANVPPPGEFDSTEIYARKRWRKAQQFAAEFWSVWKSQYLSQISKRPRWERKKDNVCVGDVVVVMDSAMPRNLWHTGTVEKVNVSDDGLVRSASVRLLKGSRGLMVESVLERPVQKLVVILRKD